MKPPIQMDQLLERVSGNMEFINLMMTTFFNTVEDRLSALNKEFENGNYDELADHAHRIKGIVGNLSIILAVDILKKLHVEAHLKNDKKIRKLITQLRKSIDDAHTFYTSSPIFKQ